MVFFDNVAKFHETTLAACGAGEWFFDYAADRIYVCDDPTSAVVETSVTPYIFPISGGVCTSTADNVTVRGLIIEKYATPTARAAIGLGCSPLGAENWLATSNEVRFNHGAGIGNDTNTSATYNYVHHNCEYGFTGAGSGVVIDHNEIAYNNILPGHSTAADTCGHDVNWTAGGSKWVYTTGLLVTWNYSHHNNGTGLWTDINNIGTSYISNTVWDNRRDGIFHEISYAAIIAYNDSRRNGTGQDYLFAATGACICVSGSPDVEVYGNYCEDNWQGITALDDDRGTGTDGPWDLINLNVHDNTIHTNTNTPGAGRTGLIDYTAGEDSFAAPANNRFEDNTYYLGAQADYFTWNNTEVDEDEWVAFGNDDTGSFSR
jgi:hypothetical protein